MIPQFDIFKGIDSIINLLQSNNIPICIVTSSPRSYCQKVINNFGWNDIKLVCYHDTKYKKPHKEPIEKAISLLGVGKEHIVSIGDDIKDIVASNSAGVTSIGVTWGTNSSTNLKDADVIFTEVDQLQSNWSYGELFKCIKDLVISILIISNKKRNNHYIIK